jgi:hypothetical protein
VYPQNGVYAKEQIQATEEDAWIFRLMRRERVGSNYYGLMTAKRVNGKWQIEFPLTGPSLSELLDIESWVPELGDAKTLQQVYLKVSSSPNDEGIGMWKFHWHLWNLETRKLIKIVEPTEPFKGRKNE